MNILPSLLIGFGETGAKTLQQIAAQVRQSYGAEAIASLSFLVLGVAPKPYNLDPAIQYQSIASDLSDWGAAFPPEVTTWFNVDYYRRRLNNAKMLSTERQLIRLQLFRFIAENPSFLPTCFDTMVSEAIASKKEMEQRVNFDVTKRNLNVYFVGTFDDPVMTGLYLDIAHLLRVMTQKVVEVRILLYAAFPEVLHKRPSLDMQLQTAIVLRELERYAVSFERHQHPRSITYPTSDSRYRETDSQYSLFFATRLYSEYLESVDALAMMFADVITPLVDRSVGEFFAQYHLVNLSSGQEQASTSNASIALISTQVSWLAIFPRYNIYQIWAHHLFNDLCTQWNTSNESWLKDMVDFLKNGRAVERTPTESQSSSGWFQQVMRWYPQKSVPTLVNELAQAPYLNGVREFIRAANIAVPQHRLKPSELDDLAMRASSIENFQQSVLRELHRLFGDDLKVSNGDGAYGKELQQYLEYHESDIQQYLYSWILNLLQAPSGGPAKTLEVLDIVYKHLIFVEQVWENTHQRLHQRLGVDAKVGFERKLEQRFQYVSHLPQLPQTGRRFWGRQRQPSEQDLSGYREYCNVVVETISYMTRSMVLNMSQQLTHRLIEYLKLWREEVALWVDIMLTGEYALQKHATDVKIPLENTHTRYQLIDEQWVAEKYHTAVLSDVLPKFIELFDWNAQGQATDPPRLELSIAVDHTAYQFDHSNIEITQQQNINAVLQACTDLLTQNIDIDMWSYINSHNVKRGKPTELKAFFTRSTSMLAFDDRLDLEMVHPPQKSVYFLKPDPENRPNSKRDIDSIRLAENPDKDLALQENYHSRIGVMTLIDFIPLQALRTYTQTAYIYQTQFSTQKAAHKYIMPEDLLPALWEHHIAKAFGDPNFRFSYELIFALNHTAQVELFMWVYILGWIQFLDDGRFYIEQEAMDILWPLSYTDNPTYIEAFVHFCYETECPPNVRARLLAAVETAIQGRAAAWQANWRQNETPFPEPDVRTRVQQLQSRSNCADEAAKLGTQYQYLKSYYDDVYQRYQANERIHEVELLCAGLAYQSYVPLERALRDLITKC